MTTFSLYRGLTTLCSWSVESGACTYVDPTWSPTRRPVLSETERYGFILEPPREGDEYRIFIGDIAASEILGSADAARGWTIQGRQVWAEDVYFDSARGTTPLIVKARREASDAELWQTVTQVTVEVVPSKVGDAAFEVMAVDMLAISRSLLVDLYGKSSRTYELRFVARTRAFRSKEEVLDAIAVTVERLTPLVHDIQCSPASRIQRATRRAQYWGAERLDRTSVMDLARRGVSGASPVRPLTVLQTRPVESFDTVEHRALKAFIGVLLQQLDACRAAVAAHIRAIQAERPYRDVMRPASHGPTLYESVDVPKLRRLREAMRQAASLEAALKDLEATPFLRGVPARFDPVTGGAFQRNALYRQLYSLIANFLRSEPALAEGDDLSTVTKLTWRLFEQWTFVRLVDAFRDAGLVLHEWGQALRQHVAARFILDFERGLAFDGTLTPELGLRIRYEPWILGEAAAKQMGETMCRVSTEDVPWSPDIVIELLDMRDSVAQPLYAIVLDCKYARRIREQHFARTRKYSEIRSTSSHRQVVHQLWLVHPAERDAIVSTDPAVAFGRDGPSMPAAEHATFIMSVLPRPGVGTPASPGGASQLDAFHAFASGTLSYLKSAFL